MAYYIFNDGSCNINMNQSDVQEYSLDAYKSGNCRSLNRNLSYDNYRVGFNLSYDCSCNINTNYYTLEENTSGKCRSINRELSNQDPQMLDKTQKEIQKTVRTQSSLFTMNLGALNVYKKPATTNKQVNVNGSSYTVSAGVNWNQMSDRPVPHIQNVKTASGSGYRSSSTKSSITRLRPGALSPGGLGVDIKHNSYERYLNRLKGKGPLREATYSINPIYGSKVRKTLIIDCPC